MSAAHKLVLLRHGESTWNKENRFTGWTDVDLTEKGYEEARAAGRLLRDGGYVFDIAYTSVLKRAIRTLWIALDELDQMWLPVVGSWRPRMVGFMTGLLEIWRGDRPPPMRHRSCRAGPALRVG